VPAAGENAHAALAYPSIRRRLICMVYEALLLCGVTFLAGLLFVGASAGAMQGWLRHAFQLYLILVIGLYFVGSWRRRGQTLAMKAWRLRLVGADGARISLRQALTRYVCAWPSLAFGAIGILYAPFDRERQFLHDRLAGTRIVKD
jgi:uncharacterized RDD family membrane protein YckC